MTPTLTMTVLPDGGLRTVDENPVQTSDREMRAEGILRDHPVPGL